MNGDRLFYSWLPAIGCLTILAVLSLIMLMPLVLVNLMRSALERLHLSPAAALASVIGIFIGSLFNLPVYRIRREESPYSPLARTIVSEVIISWPLTKSRGSQNTS